MSSLARQGAALHGYVSVAHPSLPNYLALTSGTTWGIRDDGYHPLPAGMDLGHDLSAAHIEWRAYMESMTRGCRDSPSPYAVRHNPFAYYGGACPAEVVPFSQLERDVGSSAPPRFIWITPNLCNDDHDCPSDVGDRWLRAVVPRLLEMPGYAQHGLIAIVWDESSGGGDRTPAVIISPDLTGHRSTARYDHLSLLAALEDRLRLRRLGGAASAAPLTEVLPRL
ncbi:MAG: alkaline phosphatase family protein [Candidatus Dormibacteria bacterium]